MPRQMLRNYFESGDIPRPLLVPLSFSYTAKLQKVDLKSFFTNPTVLTNTLYNAWRFFQYDGVVNYIDETLELEALGFKVYWHDESYRVVTESLELENLNWKGIKERGRIPNAIEVIRRLKIMLRDECAIVGVLNGPFTLLTSLNEKGIKGEILQTIASAELEVCRTYCEAGADLVLFIERKLPSDEKMLDEYVKALVPMRNVANFFEARLILLLKEMEKPQNLNILQDCVDGIILEAGQNSLVQLRTPYGLALPNDLFYDEKKINRFVQQKLESGLKPFLLTTKEEVYDIPAQLFRNSINALKSLKLS